MISIIHLDKEILRLNRFSKKKTKKEREGREQTVIPVPLAWAS